MLTTGTVMMICGVIGLIVTLIWITMDLVTKSKREEMLVKTATKNMTNNSSVTAGFNNMTGALLYETEGMEVTEGMNNTYGLYAETDNAATESVAFTEREINTPTEGIYLGSDDTTEKGTESIYTDEIGVTEVLITNQSGETEGLLHNHTTQGLREKKGSIPKDETEAL